MPDTPVQPAAEPSATTPAEPAPNQQVHQRTANPIYSELAATPEFAQLRRNYRGFAFPFTIAFLLWYLLYVIMSNWAGGFMNLQVVGHINVALVFGLLQFVSTFVIARMYSNHARKNLDPIAEKLQQRYEEMIKK